MLYLEVGGVSIGDNVFIGMHTTILKGVHIGNNVVIGAGSLVNKDISDNCVAAGNPCKVIMSIEDNYKKRINRQMDEAFEIFPRYVEKFKKNPPQEYLTNSSGCFIKEVGYYLKPFQDK